MEVGCGDCPDDSTRPDFVTVGIRTSGFSLQKGHNTSEEFLLLAVFFV
jgi:hypothetical protein